MRGENGNYAIAFQLPHVFFPGSSPEENARVLSTLVECLIGIDREYLRLRPKTPKLYDGRVVYERTEDWLPIPTLLYQGYGDCKSLAAMRVAELRQAGKTAMPSFRFRENPGRGVMYHVLVQTGVNKFEDPSKVCGMTDSEWSHFSR